MPCLIALTSGIFIACCLTCGILAFLFGTYLAAAGFFAICLIAFALNLVFGCMYRKVFHTTIIPPDKLKKHKEKRISAKELARFIYPSDQAFADYVKRPSCVQKMVAIATYIWSFRYNKLYYSQFFSFGAFKARWTKGKYYRKMMTWFGIVHILLVETLALLLAGAALVAWYQSKGNRAFFGNQYYICMFEAFVLAIILILLSLYELFKLKDYLAYNEQHNDPNKKAGWGTGNKAGLFGVSSGAPDDDFLDKESREAMLKNLMNNVKNNKDMFLNNKLDELLQQFGDRKCKSMILFGTGWAKEDDPRHINTFPLTPTREAEYDGEYHFTKEDMIGGFEDNVYAEAKVREVGIDEGVQGDQG